MQTQKHRVVVIGAGYAGLMATLRLAKKTRRGQVAITLVNARDTFVERVRMHQLAANQSLPHHPLSQILHGTGVELVQGEVTGLLPQEQQVMVRTDNGRQPIRYHSLVYALGSFTDRDSVPGVSQHAYTLDREPASALAERVPQVADHGGRLVVIGGGPTGVEAATELAESYPDLQVALVTQDEVGATFLSQKGQNYLRQVFDRLGIAVYDNTMVERVNAHQVVTADGRTMPFDLCLWTGGFAVSSLATEAGLTVNERGQILIDRTMRSVSHPEIYAVGDAAYPLQQPGTPIRMALYTAVMMGAHGADCLAARLNGRSPTPFGLSYIAMGISLGRRDGVTQYLVGDTDKPRNFILTGHLAAFFKELFTKFAVWAIKMQRWLPGLFVWPGKGKMWNTAVTEERAG